MCNVIEDDLWQLEPTLKPEDEILLRRLHEMLQSTADDLKVLSGELIRLHEPGIQVKTPSMPLDSEFNDRVHIEEMVNAKFYGHKIIDNPNLKPLTPKEKIHNEKFQKIKKPIVTTSAGIQTNAAPVLKKKDNNKSLGISKLRTVQIEDAINVNTESENKKEEAKFAPSVFYNEFAHFYEPKPIKTPLQQLQVQQMPSVNIRSELKEQKVFQLDIIPENVVQKQEKSNSNVAVIEMQYKELNPPPQSIACVAETKYHQPNPEKKTIRKSTKMSTCESSESDTLHKLTTEKLIKPTFRISPKNSARSKKPTTATNRDKKDSDPKRAHFNLDEWKKKLNSVYGQTSSARRSKLSSQSKTNLKKNTKNPNLENKPKPQKNYLNNRDYIPYSQLTLGGVRLSDIEREVSDGPIKNDVPLSPILDKILSSRENSFQNDSPRKNKQKSPRVLNTSDEALLQEVINIEEKVSKTLLNNEKKVTKESPQKSQNTDSDLDDHQSNQESYPDDFEEADKSDDDTSKSKDISKESQAHAEATGKNNSLEAYDSESETELKNTTYIKSSNLSLKNTVDIYEFIHSVDTQDNATQSQATQILSLKETQTSPTHCDRPNIQPIHNDLWSARSIDPKGNIEHMFQLEKDFIKKLIIDEYGDLLEKTINKPSTSKDCNEVDNNSKNVASFQKITQTSPAHVKSVMTSPTKTKTRTTSPLVLNLTTDHPTSPFTVGQNDKLVQTEQEQSEPDDFGITINLSSPRFSLKLPQSSREVLSNLELCSQPSAANIQEEANETKQTTRKPASSSTSIDADASSSEISSLGEVKFKLKRRLRKNRHQLSSESSSTSVVSRSEFSGGILPLKSDGEVDSGRKKDNSRSKTEEDSFGQL